MATAGLRASCAFTVHSSKLGLRIGLACLLHPECSSKQCYLELTQPSFLYVTYEFCMGLYNRNLYINDGLGNQW